MIPEARQAAHAPPGRAAPTGAASVAVVRDEAGLLACRAEWEDLARHALEPNPFFEPWFLIPAWRHVRGGDDVRVVLVSVPPPGGGAAVLAGLFPVVRGRLSRWAPLPVVTTWRHRYGFLGTPLLRTGVAGEALGAFLDWLAAGPLGAVLWRLDLVGAGGPFAERLGRLRLERGRPAFLVESYERAALHVGAGAEEYLARALSRRRLREVRRKSRALGRLGRLELRALAPGGDVGGWVEMFLKLEAAGWKGRAGTAFASQPADAAFLREMARGAHEAGRLQALGLFLDGRPVAMTLNLLARPGLFGFKIAYDEGHHSQSPGAQLAVAMVEHLHAERAAEWVDSCALPDHPLVDRLWAERRTVQSQLLATGRAPGALAVSLMPALRWLKRRFRPRAAPAPGGGP